MSILPRAGLVRAMTPFYDWAEQNVPPGAVNAALAGLTGQEEGMGAVKRTVINFTNVAYVLVDNPGVIAYKGNKIYDFPEGSIKILGATCNLVMTKSSAGVIATWAGKVGLGSTVADNTATLTGTEQDIVPQTNTAAAVAGVGAAKARNAADIAPFDGSATALDLYLNYLVNDTDHDVTTTPCNIIFNGSVIVHWLNLGDY